MMRTVTMPVLSRRARAAALLITTAVAGIALSAQGRGAGQVPAPTQQGRGADAEIPTALREVSMPWPPMHIYIRGGLKSHGPGLHDYPQFMADWSKLLTERGAIVDGGFHFPTTAELSGVNVIVMYKGDAGYMSADERDDARGVPETGRRAGQLPRHAVRRRSAVSGEHPRRRQEARRTKLLGR